MNIIEYYSEIEKFVEKNAMIDLFGVGTFEEQYFTFNKLGLWLLKADKQGEETYTIECLMFGAAAQKLQSIENYEKNVGIVLSTARNAVDSLRRSLERNTKIGSINISPLVVENETYGTGIVGYSFEMKLRLPRPKFKPTVKAKEEPPSFNPNDPTYSISQPVGFPPTTTYSLSIANNLYSLGSPTTVEDYRLSVISALVSAGATFEMVETTQFNDSFHQSTTISNSSLVVDYLQDDNSLGQINFTSS